MLKPRALTHITAEEWAALTEEQQEYERTRWAAQLARTKAADQTLAAKHKRLVKHHNELVQAFNKLERRVETLEKK